MISSRMYRLVNAVEKKRTNEKKFEILKMYSSLILTTNLLSENSLGRRFFLRRLLFF